MSTTAAHPTTTRPERSGPSTGAGRAPGAGRRRGLRVATTSLLVAALVGAGSAAQAKTVTTTTSWWGKTVTVYFNKAETARIATGSGACSGVVGLIPGVPSTIVKASCAVMAGYAGIAVATSSCVGVAYYFSKGMPYPNLGYKGMYHNKAYCR
jgi:hypothetical protein